MSLSRKSGNSSVGIFDYPARTGEILPNFDLLLPKFHFILPKFHFILPKFHFILPKFHFILPNFYFVPPWRIFVCSLGIPDFLERYGDIKRGVGVAIVLRSEY